MASWIKNMKDGSRRLKDEFVRTIGVGGEGDACMDPVLDFRTQRFNRYNENLEKLSKSMSHYLEASRTFSIASANLMHSFSTFFEAQLQDYSPEEVDFVDAKSLAQSALRLEEIHQSLRCNVFHTAHEMQVARVSKSIHHLQQTNAGLQKQIQVLKQRLVDYESTRRSVEGQKKGTPEYERMQQKAVAMEGSLVSLTSAIHSDLNALEARRSIDMKNELLSVVASELFIHSRCKDHLEQLLPLLPGLARPLVELAEFARSRPVQNPAEHEAMGVVSYTTRGIVDLPLQFHSQLLLDVDADASAVHPLQPGPFKDMHLAEKLAMDAYQQLQHAQ